MTRAQFINLVQKGAFSSLSFVDLVWSLFWLLLEIARRNLLHAERSVLVFFSRVSRVSELSCLILMSKSGLEDCLWRAFLIHLSNVGKLLQLYVLWVWCVSRSRKLISVLIQALINLGKRAQIPDFKLCHRISKPRLLLNFFRIYTLICRFSTVNARVGSLILSDHGQWRNSFFFKVFQFCLR